MTAMHDVCEFTVVAVPKISKRGKWLVKVRVGLKHGEEGMVFRRRYMSGVEHCRLCWSYSECRADNIQKIYMKEKSALLQPISHMACRFTILAAKFLEEVWFS